jgi:hypothetical protein
VTIELNVLNDWPYRVCLPYEVDLLQLARWVDLAGVGRSPPEFSIVVGGGPSERIEADAVALCAGVQNRCLGYALAHSRVECPAHGSMMFFEAHERFSCFAAQDPAILRALYPFSREIMWENFALNQGEEDVPLIDIFRAVHWV